MGAYGGLVWGLFVSTEHPSDMSQLRGLAASPPKPGASRLLQHVLLRVHQPDVDGQPVGLQVKQSPSPRKQDSAAAAADFFGSVGNISGAIQVSDPRYPKASRFLSSGSGGRVAEHPGGFQRRCARAV